MSDRAIVVGGGLAGLSAACELLERGFNVTILEKTPKISGGNSSKATCGIASPGSALQGEQDDAADIIADSPAAEALVKGGAKDLDWLIKALGVSNELVLRRLPGHGKTARCFGSNTHFPGAVVTYAAIHVLGQIAKAKPDRVELISKVEVKQLLLDGGKVVGVEYVNADQECVSVTGQVILATGGYAGNQSDGSYLATNRPDLANLPTTNDDRASGDGIKLALAAGAVTSKMDSIEVVPTAVNIPGREDDSFKLVISDAICGAGGKLFDASGARFCDELAPSPERVQAMNAATGPFRLVIGEEDAQSVEWLMEFYTSKKFMEKTTAKDLAKMFKKGTVEGVGTGTVFVATVMPAVYSCGGGIETGWGDGKEGKVLNQKSEPIEGLFAAGEVVATPYKNLWSVSGIPLLHAVYSGRMAGRAAAAKGEEKPVQELKDILISAITNSAPKDVSEAEEKKEEEKKEEKKPEDMTKDELLALVKDLKANGAKAAPAAPTGPPTITLEEVAKHNKKEDAWIVLFGEVIDVTKWIDIHPGGVQAICAFLGQDATDEWKMIHKPGTVEKNLAHVKKLGKVGTGEPAAAAAGPADAGGLTVDDVAKHNKKEDAWIILFGEAIDVTKWIPVHPGGEAAIMAYVGKDATDEWKMIHKPGTVEKNLAHVKKMGKVSGAAATAQAAPTGPDEPSAPDGDGGIPGVLGALIFTALNLIRLVIPGRIFFTGNFKFKLENNRNGTIRSALFLITFIIIHALGNFADMVGGPNELNGEGYLFDRIHWTGAFGFWNLCPFSVVEEYLALCFALHIIVALKRSWDISVNYCIYTGRWNMLISGLSILFFLTQHLQDFRFYEGFEIIDFRAPPYFIAFDGLMEGRIFAEDQTDKSIPIVKVRDIYSHEVVLFKDLGTTMLYQVLITIFIMHMCMGWKKMCGADAFQIPKEHQNRVKWIGWIAAVAVAAMYMSVPWYVYFAEPEKVVPAS